MVVLVFSLWPLICLSRFPTVKLHCSNRTEHFCNFFRRLRYKKKIFSLAFDRSNLRIESTWEKLILLRARLLVYHGRYNRRRLQCLNIAHECGLQVNLDSNIYQNGAVNKFEVTLKLCNRTRDHQPINSRNFSIMNSLKSGFFSLLSPYLFFCQLVLVTRFVFVVKWWFIFCLVIVSRFDEWLKQYWCIRFMFYR